MVGKRPDRDGSLSPRTRAREAPPSPPATEPLPPACVTEHQRRLASSSASVSKGAGKSLDKMGYCWEQTPTEVRIIFDVSASDDQIHCDFSKYGCSLSVQLGTERYFFEIKRLFAAIDPALSLAKVPRSKRHV